MGKNKTNYLKNDNLFNISDKYNTNDKSNEDLYNNHLEAKDHNLKQNRDDNSSSNIEDNENIAKDLSLDVSDIDINQSKIMDFSIDDNNQIIKKEILLQSKGGELIREITIKKDGKLIKLDEFGNPKSEILDKNNASVIEDSNLFMLENIENFNEDRDTKDKEVQKLKQSPIIIHIDEVNFDEDTTINFQDNLHQELTGEVDASIIIQKKGFNSDLFIKNNEIIQGICKNEDIIEVNDSELKNNHNYNINYINKKNFNKEKKNLNKGESVIKNKNFTNIDLSMSFIFDENLPYGEQDEWINEQRNEEIQNIYDKTNIKSLIKQDLNLKLMKSKNNLINFDSTKKDQQSENFDKKYQMKNPNDYNYLLQIEISDEDDQELQKEILLYSDLNNESQDLLNNKKLRRKDLKINRLQKLRNKQIKNQEKKQTILNQIMKSENGQRSFETFIKFLNIFSEDIVDEEFQNIIKKIFSRNDIINIMELKRHTGELKLRCNMLKILKINYLLTPISYNKNYFDLFYINEADFFSKLYNKSTAKSIIHFGNILIYEFTNFHNIIMCFLDKYNNNEKKNQFQIDKILFDYICNGLIGSLKIFVDKVYSEGQNITGEELLLVYKISYEYMEVKIIIDSFIQGKTINESLELVKEKNKNPLENLFTKDLGGIDNFKRKTLFNFLYEQLQTTLDEIEIKINFYLYDGINKEDFINNPKSSYINNARDNFDKNMNDKKIKIGKQEMNNFFKSKSSSLKQIISSYYRVMHKNEFYNGINFLPNLLTKLKTINPEKIDQQEIKILTEYSNICKIYLKSLKNFRQGPLFSIFNGMTNEKDFNYREIFIKFFLFVISNERFKYNYENNLIEIVNKCFEYEQDLIHEVFFKFFQMKKSEHFFNEINRKMIYNMIILLIYMNRKDVNFIWEKANYNSCLIINFFTLLSKGCRNKLGEFILKYCHRIQFCDDKQNVEFNFLDEKKNFILQKSKKGETQINSNLFNSENQEKLANNKKVNHSGKLLYNFFILLEALLSKIIKSSRWGKFCETKNEIFYDNLFVIFHKIIQCLTEYCHDSDEDGINLIYERLKSIIYGLKRILFYQSEEPDDIIYEIKLSILQLLLALIEENNGSKIIDDLIFHFDPFHMFKLCVFHFKLLISKWEKTNPSELYILRNDIGKKHTNSAAFSTIKKLDFILSIDPNLKQLINLYNSNDDFANENLLQISFKLFTYIKILKENYKNLQANKCIYAIKRFKNILAGFEKRGKHRNFLEYKYFYRTGSIVDTFLEQDEINETEFVIYSFIKKHIKCIEVFSQKNKLEIINFTVVPLTCYINYENLARFEDFFFQRDMAFKKINSLNVFINETLEQCFYSFHLSRTNKLVSIIDKVSYFLYYKIVVCIVNVIICCMTWAKIDNSGNKVLDKLCFAFDLINLGFMIAIITIWFAVRFYPLYRQKKINFMKISQKYGSKKDISFFRNLKIIIIDTLLRNYDFVYLFFNIIFTLLSLITEYASFRYFVLASYIIISFNLVKLLHNIANHIVMLFNFSIIIFILLMLFTSISYDFMQDTQTVN